MDTLVLFGIVIVVIALINLFLYIGVKLGQNASPLPISPENKLVLQYSFLLSFWAGITGASMFYFFDKMSLESAVIFGITCLINFGFFFLIGKKGK